MAIGPRFPFAEPQKHRVPLEWQHVVCTCLEDHGTKHDLDKFGPYMLCRKCGLLKRFYTSRCSMCGDFYLIVFKCREWTPYKNLCWDCIPGRHSFECDATPEWAKPRDMEEITHGLDDFFKFVVDLEDSVTFDF